MMQTAVKKLLKSDRSFGGSFRGYKLATKSLKTQRKSIFLENMVTKNPENTPFATRDSPNLIREGGRTVGSGRVATIIE